MRKYGGRKIGDLSRLSLKELRDNISIDFNDYIERAGIYKDGMYFVDVPFRNGEWVKAVIYLHDDRVQLIFINNSIINNRPKNSQIQGKFND